MVTLNKFITFFFFLSILFILSFLIADMVLLPLIQWQVIQPKIYEYLFMGILSIWLVYHLGYEIMLSYRRKNRRVVSSLAVYLSMGILRFFYKIIRAFARFALYAIYLVILIAVFMLFLYLNEWLIELFLY